MTPRPNRRRADCWARHRCRCGGLPERGHVQCGKCASRTRWTRRRAHRHPAQS